MAGWQVCLILKRSARLSVKNLFVFLKKNLINWAGRFSGCRELFILMLSKAVPVLQRQSKAHHNVGGLPEDMRLALIEPLRELFKDEVRAVGEELGIPSALVWRQHFLDLV